jgi:signal transduction histidine kinase
MRELIFSSPEGRILGIGLSLVKSIAKKYGGEVVVWSQVGVGSRVQLDLPAMVFEKFS